MPITVNQSETNGEKRFSIMPIIAALALTLTVLEEIEFVIINKFARTPRNGSVGRSQVLTEKYK